MDCRRYNVYKLEQLESYDTSLNYLWWYSSIPSKGTRQKKKLLKIPHWVWPPPLMTENVENFQKKN